MGTRLSPISTVAASMPNTAASRSGDSASAGSPSATIAPSIHHSDTIGEARREREIVHDGEHRAAAARGLAQQFHHDELVARIERGGRLVGEQHGRLRRERAGERDARASRRRRAS